MKIPNHVLQKLRWRQPRVKHVGVVDLAAVQQMKQATDQQSLARANFSRHHYEAFASPNSVIQRRQRFVVSLGGKKKGRIGSNLERVPLQIVEALIHWGM